MRSKPRVSPPSRGASSTKLAARKEKAIPAAAKPVVNAVDAISETAQKPKASAQIQEISPTKPAVSEEKVIPAAAKPVVSVTDAISETTQKPKAIAEVQETSPTEAAVEQLVEQVIPIAAKPVIGIAGAISETVPIIADTASVSEEVKPIAAIDTTNPGPIIGTKTMIKNPEDFVALGHANMEAFVKSGQIWAAGVQDLMRQFAVATKLSFDESASAFTAITSAKSVTEAFELQSKFAGSVAAKALTESTKLIDASIKLTEQTLAPITARVGGTVEIFGKAA